MKSELGVCVFIGWKGMSGIPSGDPKGRSSGNYNNHYVSYPIFPKKNHSLSGINLITANTFLQPQYHSDQTRSGTPPSSDRTDRDISPIPTSYEQAYPGFRLRPSCSFPVRTRPDGEPSGHSAKLYSSGPTKPLNPERPPAEPGHYYPDSVFWALWQICFANSFFPDEFCWNYS